MIRSSLLGNELKLRISQPLSFLAEDFFFLPPSRRRPVHSPLEHFLNSLSALCQMHPVLRRSSRLQSKRKRSHDPPPAPVHVVPAAPAPAHGLILLLDDHDDVQPPNPKRRKVDPVVNSPALQPVSYSRFPRRGRSPLSTDPSLPSSSTSAGPQPSLPPSPPASPSFLSLPFPRRRRNVYTENNGRIPSLWKYICVERIETLYAFLFLLLLPNPHPPNLQL